jgi:hypothetical protein
MVLYRKCSNFNAFMIGLVNVPLQQLMERRIRPWINKKIIEYIGEPEPTLVDFICSKVLAGSAPQGILDDVQMVSCDLGGIGPFIWKD